jgi:hypothetical protein
VTTSDFGEYTNGTHLTLPPPHWKFWRMPHSVLSRMNRNHEGKRPPRLCGQFWMIRRFTAARLFPPQRLQRKRTT